jgi:hypothetical protein
MSYGEKGTFFKTVAETVGCSSKHAQRAYDDLVQSHKRNELRSLYRSGIQEEPLSEISALVTECISLIDADPKEIDRINKHKALLVQPQYDSEDTDLREGPSPTIFEEPSSVLSEQSSTRSAPKRRRRNAQGLVRFQALTDEISKHNRMLVALLRRFNINYSEFEQ